MKRTTARYRADYLKMRSVLWDRSTGLPALALHFDRLRTWLDERRHVGVIHVELAGADLIEAMYGWQVFDRLRERATAALRVAVAEQLPRGTEIALNGVAGDRLIVLVPAAAHGRDVEPEELGRLASGIESRLGAALARDGVEVHAGCALLSENPFLRFERCVYAAVEDARRSAARRRSGDEQSWSDELRGVIRDRALNVVYQPVVDLVSAGEVVGHEAFVRGPQGTMFEAPRPMFELSGRLGVLHELDHACSRAALEGFSDLEPASERLFVNAIAGGCTAEWRKEVLLPLLARLELPSSRVVIEFSERELGRAEEAVAGRAAELRADGFAIAIDDMGTGRSDLRTLERVEPQYVKLDGSLVRGIDGSVVQQEILHTLVDLARRVDATVVAEEVETESEARTVRDAGATLAQGFFYAAPRGRP